MVGEIWKALMVFEAEEEQRKTYSRPRKKASIMYFLLLLKL